MSVFSAPAFDNHETVAFQTHQESGLHGIIAVHNTRLGPSLGGCRMYPYSSDEAALHDVLRLSRGMTYKSALAGLPFGGGKAVIIGDPHSQKTRALLLAMGDFVEFMGGRYIVAEDSGTGVADVRVMGERTSHVSGLYDNIHGGDPSPSTALGVYLGICAGVRHSLGLDSPSGLSIAIQGLGNVGFILAKRLLEDGAVVYGADVNQSNQRRAVEAGVIAVEPSELLSMEVDILSPCAMGAILNEFTIPTLRARLIAGAANNQLASNEDDRRLAERGIVYCPDFLINAGGVIELYHQKIHSGEAARDQHLKRIGDTLTEVLRRADEDNQQTQQIAEELAEEALNDQGVAQA